MNDWDVIVVGGGNAGYAAALSARKSGANKVLIVEKSRQANDYRGGNSYFTAGAFRTVFNGLHDLRPILHKLDDETAGLIDMEPYTYQQFYDDVMRVTSGRADPSLTHLLVSQSRPTISWLDEVGIQFCLSFHRQAYKVQGRYKFWGGMVLSTVDGGKGLIDQWEQAATKHGIHIQYGTQCVGLSVDPACIKVNGVHVVSQPGATSALLRCSGGVILACGGFEASASLRAQYLGPSWEMAHVRGSPYNTGDGLLIAQRDCHAASAGGWSSCHSTCWDLNTSPYRGHQELTNQFTKSGYPLGLMINSDGLRFVDEGMDFRNYTYAFFGKEILKQPGGVAYQVYDSRVLDWLRKEEYADDVVDKVVASTLEELVDKLALVDNAKKGALRNKQQFLRTIQQYNTSVYAHQKHAPHHTWDPSVKDGLSTQSPGHELVIPKSNWSLPLDKPPFVAIKVTTGITFTFGGLAIDPQSSNVLNTSGMPIDGLWACGEMVGGVFYENYPGGSGLMLGAITGRNAGIHAAKASLQRHLHTGKL